MIKQLTCTTCHRPVARNEAVQRGDLRTVRAWHRACFTFHRATVELDADVFGMPLTRRLLESGAEGMSK